MYVPIEGVQQVLSSLPAFSYEKFALEHGVYIVTPLQLGTTLGVIADVAHAEKRGTEHTALQSWTLLIRLDHA
jgi:hypothetical protein